MIFNFTNIQDLKSFSKVEVFLRPDPGRPVVLCGMVEQATHTGAEVYIKTNLEYGSFVVDDIYAIHFLKN